MKQQATMEFIPGHGYYWQGGGKVYQEDQLIPNTPLPIGHTDYGFCAVSQGELHVSSASEGFWVMDRRGSYHRHPFRTEKGAVAYLAALQNNKAER